MKICEECGNEFDEEELEGCYLDRDSFISPAPWYDYFKRCLCEDCALDIYEHEDISEYSHECENCHCEYHPLTVKDEFESSAHGCIDPFSWYSDIGSEEDLCLDCLLEKYYNDCRECDDDNDDNDDNDEDDS